MTPNALAGSDVFAQAVSQCVAQAELELDRRGVTLETADQWEQISYAEDLMTGAGSTLCKMELRARDGSDWFRIAAVLNDGGTNVEIVVTTPARGQELEAMR